MVNSDREKPIHPGRGLRQGGVFSLYLFILVAEGLSSLIKRAVDRGDIHGIQICRAPMVSHLLFADNCFLFCMENLSEVRHLMNILEVYAEASGQEINTNESEVLFTRNISNQAREDISRIMGVRLVLGTCTYLGLPSMLGRSKKATFAFIKDRIWKRINSWRGWPMSKACKEVMIKSVLQDIPAYVMSVFILLDTLVDDIKSMLNALWWEGGSKNKWIRWLTWESLTYPKNEGGLDFRDFKAFNMAMVVKQGWNIMTNQDT
ncbi:uncharacterized protein LOC131627792 [Vicia villosa]|uniref:uncharacterized protein LOC131627792 n=1 Tax=Vicia villosa TaxID=3911 RepID=UPI00273CB644|nr:uncharacterized protein LOC131627792 [Vicia villosa]